MILAWLLVAYGAVPLRAQSAFCDVPMGSALHQSAYIAALALPVYADDPFNGKKGEFTVDLVIHDRNLLPLAMHPASDEQVKTETVRAISQCVFEPAQYDGEPVPAFFRTKIDDYFYVRKPRDLAKVPMPRFSIGGAFKQRLDLLTSAERQVFDGDGRFELYFEIDEQGACTGIRTKGSDQKDVGKALNEIRGHFTFQPAMRDGQAVPCELVLVIQNSIVFPKRDKKAVQEDPEWEEQPLPALPADVLEKVEDDVSTVLYFYNEKVQHIWFPGLKDYVVAAYMARTLRDWQPPGDNGYAKTCFAFDGESGEGMLTQQITNFKMLPPKAVERPRMYFPNNGKVYIDGKLITRALVQARFMVMPDGTVGEIVVEIGHPIFVEEVTRVLKKMKFEPATFDGRPTLCWVRQEFPFKLR
ncbi:MAG: energy transducer TonB [Verrucomicrobiota bacterium JB022]|nr:energy transducer TonB [Verrucomicrobiota bacterium JB022]